MSFSLFRLLTGHPPALVDIFPLAAGVYEDWLSNKPRRILSRRIELFRNSRAALNSTSSLRSLIHTPFVISSLVVWSILEFLRSIMRFFENCYAVTSLVSIIWISLGIYCVIRDCVPLNQVKDDENAMEFGQVVPLFPLASTAFVMREAIEGTVNQCSGVHFRYRT